MRQEISLFGLELKTFGIFFALCFLASGAIVLRRMTELGRPGDWAYEMTFSALIGGLIGSRLYYLVQNYDDVKDDLLGSIFSGSGLVWYGGAIGGAIGVVIWARRRGMLNVGLLDLAAPALAVGYAVGRIGCQVSGDGDYGKPWDGPWAMAYPDGAVPTTDLVHPTPIYETLAMGLGGYVLWAQRDRVRPGILFALYLVIAGVERFLVEFLRRNEAVAAGLTTAQLESLVLAAVGLAWLVRARRGDGWFLSDPQPGARPATA